MNWRNYLCKPLLDNKSNELNTTIINQSKQITSLKEDVIKLKEKLKESESLSNLSILYKNKIDELNLKIKKLESNDYSVWETFWNERRVKVEHFTWVRHDKSGNYEIDVRNWLMPNDSNLPIITGKDYDDIAWKCLVWVMENIKYESDTKVFGDSEYWAFPYECIIKKKGDCEDGSNILHSLMLKNGIPYWRVRGNIGSVNGGYHAYLTYCRETDNQWVCCDWCYWNNYKKIADRPLHKDEQNYSDPKKNFMVDGSWNLKYCYGRMETMAQ